MLHSHATAHAMLYYTVLYYTILYNSMIYYTIIYYTILYYTALYYTIPYHTIPYHNIPYHTIPCHTIRFNEAPTARAPERERSAAATPSLYTVHSMLHYTTPCCKVQYNATLCCALLYYTIPYHTIP